MKRKRRVGFGHGHPYLALLTVLAVMVVVRHFDVHSRAARSEWNLLLFYAILTVGFSWVFGLSGQFAFSQAAFAGLGAFTSAYIARHHVPAAISIVLAALAAAAAAGAFGYLVRRAGAFYFAIATLGFSQIILLVLRQWRSFTGAEGGITDNVPTLVVGHWRANTPYREAWIFFVVLAAVLLGGIFIERSPLRREAISFRDQEQVAATAGVAVLRVRLVTFALGSATAALAGGVYAHTEGFLSPDSFDIDLGLAVFLMLIVGGVRSRWGPLLGAAFYVYSPTVLDHVHLHRWTQIVYGVVLVVVMVILPDGLAGTVERVRRRWSGSESSEPAANGTEGGPLEQKGPFPAHAASGGADRMLAADSIAVSFGGVRAVDGVSLDVGRGEIVGLVGPNGSGKSTFLNALTGLVPASGSASVAGHPYRLSRPGAPRRAGLLRTFQTPQIYRELTCLDNVCLAHPDRRATGLTGAWLRRRQMQRLERDRVATARDALRRVGLEREENRLAGELAYGSQRLLELARVITGRPSIVLLDEPSAGLNPAESLALTAHLRQLRDDGAALLVVDHKIDFLAALCDRVAVLELGRLVAVGPPHEVFADQRVIDAYLGRAPESAEVAGPTSESGGAGPC